MISGRDNIIEFLNALWGRRWYAIAVAWFVCLAGWATVAAMPDQYQVVSRVFIDTSTILRPLLRGIAVEPDIADEVQLMRQTLLSRGNAEKVMRMTDLDLDVTTEEKKEKLIASLQRNTTISSARGGPNLFSITFKHSDPVRARDVVQAFTTVFVENNIGESRDDAEAAREFLDEQTQFYREQLEENERRLADFQREYRQLLPEASRNISTNFSKARNDLNAAIARRDAFRRQLSTINQYNETTEQAAAFGSGPPAFDELQISELEAAVEILLTQYTKNHPDVVAANRRLTAMKERLAVAQARNEDVQAQEAASPVVFREANPVYGALKIELVQLETNIAVLRQQFERVKNSWEQIQHRADMAPLLAAEQKKLQRDYGIVKTKYEQLLERRESMKIATERSIKSDDVKFRIVDPPVVPTRPIGPNRPFFLNVVLLFGLGTGLGTAGLFVITRHTFQNVRALRSSFPIPIYGAVRDLRTGLRRGKVYLDYLGVSLAAGGLVAVFLFLLLIENSVGLPNIASFENAPQSIEQMRQILIDSVGAFSDRV